jgi:hypothetical protein
MYEHDVQALIELLQRIPMTKAEALWATGLIARLRIIAQRAAAQSRGSEGPAPEQHGSD